MNGILYIRLIGYTDLVLVLSFICYLISKRFVLCFLPKCDNVCRAVLWNNANIHSLT